MKEFEAIIGIWLLAQTFIIPFIFIGDGGHQGWTDCGFCSISNVNSWVFWFKVNRGIEKWE